MKVTGGINWLVMGVLKNKEKYCAVLDMEVRPLFRKCGLANLMKHTELELAKREKCDFIHTCLLYTSDAADDLLCVDLGGRRIIKKQKNEHTYTPLKPVRRHARRHNN